MKVQSHFQRIIKAPFTNSTSFTGLLMVLELAACTALRLLHLHQSAALPLLLRLPRIGGLTASRGVRYSQYYWLQTVKSAKISKRHGSSPTQTGHTSAATVLCGVLGCVGADVAWTAPYIIGIMTLSPRRLPSSNSKHIFFAITERTPSEVCLPKIPFRCLPSPRSRRATVGTRGTGSKRSKHCQIPAANY
jgi:hypothetical protein